VKDVSDKKTKGKGGKQVDGVRVARNGAVDEGKRADAGSPGWAEARGTERGRRRTIQGRGVCLDACGENLKKKGEG